VTTDTDAYSINEEFCSVQKSTVVFIRFDTDTKTRVSFFQLFSSLIESRIWKRHSHVDNWIGYDTPRWQYLAFWRPWLRMWDALCGRNGYRRKETSVCVL